MKFRSLLPFVAFIAVVAAIWLFTQPKEPATEKTAVTEAPANNEAPKPAAPIPASLAKVVPPIAAPAQPSAPQPAAAIATTPAEEPRANLETAIAEAARLIEANDIVTLFKEFAPPDEMAHLPPGMSIDQIAQMMQTEPGMDQRMQKSLDALHAIQGQTPIMSDSDNTASYEATMPDGTTKKVVMKKGDTGLWYIEDM